MQPNTTPLSPHTVPGPFRIQCWGGGRAAFRAVTICGTFRPSSVPEGAESCVSSTPGTCCSSPEVSIPYKMQQQLRASSRRQPGRQWAPGNSRIPSSRRPVVLWEQGAHFRSFRVKREARNPDCAPELP